MSKYVYFVESSKDKFIKIGYTRQIHDRLKSLEKEYGELNLIGLMHGDKKKESEVHSLFANQRMYGEWFTYSDELLEYIREFATINIDSVEKPQNYLPQRSLLIHFSELLETKMNQENRFISLDEVSLATSVTTKTLGTNWVESNARNILQIHVPTAIRLCQYFECSFGDLVSFDE